MSFPLIGITSWKSDPFGPLARYTYNLSENYIRAAQAAGGLPMAIPPLLKENELRVLFERVDGLLLSGGGDLDPACFGEARHRMTAGISAERDRTELMLGKWALAENKPILAICRGIQVMNVAMGGTLVQDIGDQISDEIVHRYSDDTPRDFVAHTVRVDAASRLAHILGSTEAGVNSWHHQSCKVPGQGLIYTAWAPDGVVEGLEAPGHRFAVAIQWHPEEMFHNRADMLALFHALVEAAV